MIFQTAIGCVFHTSFPLCLKEIIELRLGIQILFEPEDPLVINNISNFTIGIEKVSEFPRPRRTGFHAGWISSIPHPLDTEGALVNGTLHPWPVSKIVNGGVQFLLGNVGFCPVEDPPFIGTGGNAIPAADAPVIIDHHQPIRFFPGGVHRTDLHARRVFTVLALHGHVEKPFLRDLGRIVVMLGVFKIDQVSSLEPEDPDPVELGFVSGVIVFFYTGINAPPAADTAGKLKTVAPESIGECILRTDLEFLPVLL